MELRNIDDRPEKGWFSRQELADLLGVSLTQFERTYQGIVPASETRFGAHKKLWIRGRAWMDAYTSMQLRKAGADEFDDGPTDGSPGLERGRMAKAKILEIQLEKELQNVVDRDWMVGKLLGALGPIRDAVNRMQKEFGPKAYEVMKEAIEEATRTVEDVCGSDDFGGETGCATDGASGVATGAEKHPAAEATDAA